MAWLIFGIGFLIIAGYSAVLLASLRTHDFLIRSDPELRDGGFGREF
jgi:hypothetical protein